MKFNIVIKLYILEMSIFLFRMAGIMWENDRKTLSKNSGL